LSYFPELSMNDNSIMVRLTYRGRSLLLAADTEREAERRLLPVLGPIEVLKVAHHGSRSSSTAAFLNVLKPRLAVISCGEDNHFGFPDAEVVRRLERLGATVLRTDVDGMLTLSATASGWRASTERGRTLVFP
jgi:competence protein ComEC